MGFSDRTKKLLVFLFPEELRRKSEYYLAREDLWRGMAKEAHGKLRRPTYLERANKILRVYEEVKKQ